MPDRVSTSRTRAILSPAMRSCFGFLFVMLVLSAVFGTSALIWYLSSTSEFSHKDTGGAPPVSQTHDTGASRRAVVPHTSAPAQ